MNYKTIDELNNFDFSESVISEVETMNGTFHLWLDNVTILPECSCKQGYQGNESQRISFIRIQSRNTGIYRGRL